jgi:hypothetical protein
MNLFQMYKQSTFLQKVKHLDIKEFSEQKYLADLGRGRL